MITLTELLNQIDPISLVYITLLGFYFRSYMKKNNKDLGDKIDKLGEKFDQMNIRLTWIEGALHGSFRDAINRTGSDPSGDRVDKH